MRATDKGVGVKDVNVTLDGEAIDIPYTTSSAKLNPGDHVVQVTAEDKAGNMSEKAVNFSTVVEMPHKPEIVSPPNGEKDVDLNPTLKVKMSDPTDDDLDVTFYRGHKYNVESEERVKAYKGATGVEPPRERVPEDEEPLTEEEYAKLLDADDEYLVTDSTEEFPYLRFEVQVDKKLDKKNMVELIWQGKSLDGRKVTMYAWNYVESKWDAISSSISEEEKEFTLTGNVNVAEYVKEQTANILIQDQIPPPEDYDYTFVWMSDTQFYTEIWPHIFESQVNWIRDNEDEMNIKYVSHTGDIVNEENEPYQWQRADQYMGVLDQVNIPYGVLAGNHDLTPDNDYKYFVQYFGENRFKDKPYYGESYKNNRGHYDLISSHGNDYIMVTMGWDIGEEEIAWMNRVLKKHPDRKAILSFHDYLQANGTRSLTGDTIFQKVVVPNKNVIAVLSGHYTGSEKLVDEIDDDGDGTPDRKVYQMLSDYQGFEEGGQGYMKLLHVDTSSNKILVKTYSPYKDDYNYFDPEEYPEKDEFTIDLDTEPQVKRVATNYFEVNVYTDTKIGRVRNVKSGREAEVKWRNLQANKTYYWYVIAEDRYGGRSVSDIARFTTGNGLSGNGEAITTLR